MGPAGAVEEPSVEGKAASRPRRADAPAASASRPLRLRDALRGQARVVGVLLAWSVLEAGQTFLLGYALARAMDDGFLRGRQGTGLWWLGLAAVGVPVGAYGTGRVFRGVAALVEPLRDRLVRRVVRRGLGDAVRGGGSGAARPADSAVVSRLTHQVEIARDAFGGLVMVLRSFVFTAAGALAGMIALAPVLLLVVLPPLAAGVGLFVAALRPLARRQDRFLSADEAVAEECGELAAGLRDITACGAREPMAARADVRIEAAQRAARSLARFGVVRTAALAIGGQLPLVLLLLTAPWLLSSHRVTPGALLGAFAYLTQSLQPALQNLLHTLGAAGTRLGVILARLTAPEPPEAPELPEPPAPPAVTATEPGLALQLRRLTFAYGPGAEPVLRDLDLGVAQGEHLAVVGPSGTGKSTLAGLVAGLLRPAAGEVRRNGEVVLVPQEAYVFRGTVAENVGYLRPEAGPDDVLAAVAAVGADALVAALGGPEGAVDPAELSAGERQLLALARTYAARGRIVVLDEATCHLDAAAEARAERAFAARPATTLLVVAHRISSARRADRTLVLDGPRTVCAPHDTLLAASPLYRDLTAAWSPAPAG
ncbi:ATP-binding cassette domain-containing protein [Actinacidiphila epipremni]|uniref:ATP-binding cassette domain-containing protein n=1 Tax=Actinacidiphila epipremni TaxID=2053013 RepID=UPI001F116A96|nr:ABC transporter ATP-binding protein [Actinacidiphila epipremni]